MPECRAHRIGHDGHIISVTPLVCSDDTDAIDQADQLANEFAVELWQGDRLIIRMYREPEVKEPD